MPPKDIELHTPWLRAELIDFLVKLSDVEWQEENWVRVCQGSSGLDAMLDFFDDTGVLVEPQGRLGYILADDEEVSAMTALNAVIDRAISASVSSDAALIHSQAWVDVVTAASEALMVMRGEYQ
ncbi:hypothetical protein AB0C81_19185 [Streptomyces roseoverticillatus]|uniref:SCO4402 family protein n=1 Tax=Streptomyces roseoverticillatus TaxID=66429 RepID=UPI0034064B0B